jgi:hypothetical protein
MVSAFTMQTGNMAESYPLTFQVAMVRRVNEYDSYLSGDISLEGVVAHLNRLGIPSPRGCERWGKTTVHNILTNPVYAGSYVWGKVPQGKYFRCDGVEVQPNQQKAKPSRRSPEDWFIIPDHHEPLVPRDVFDRVQVLLAANRIRTSPSRVKNEYPFSQLLRCAHCKATMYGTKVESGGKKYATYRCGSNMSNAACRSRQIREAVLVDILVEVLQEKFLEQGNIDRLRASLHRQKSQAASGSDGRKEELKTKVARLEGQIAKATKNILLLDEEDIASAKAQLRQWRQEKSEAEAEIERVGRPAAEDDVEQLLARVTKLVECVRSADPHAVRLLWRETIARVDLRFDEVQKARVTRYPLASGEVYLVECAGSSSYGRAVGR